MARKLDGNWILGSDIHGHGDMGVGTPTGGKSFSLCLPSDSASFLYHGSIEYWLLQVNPKFGPTDWVKHCIPAPHLASLFFLGRRTWITQWGIILLMSIGKYHQRDHITEAYISNLIPYLPDSTYREYRFAPPRILT